MARCSVLIPSLKSRHALFRFNQGELLCVPRVFVSILNVCKYFLYLAFNDYRFRDLLLASSAVALLALVRVRVCFCLPLLFKRFRSFIVAVILFDSGVPVV